MDNVIQFCADYRVLFNLPEEKVVKLRKTAADDFDIEITDGHGIAYVKAAGKINAASRIKKVFPSAEIVEAIPL
jgi:hypothetical protein